MTDQELLNICQQQYKALQTYWKKPTSKNWQSYEIACRNTDRAIRQWGKTKKEKG